LRVIEKVREGAVKTKLMRLDEVDRLTRQLRRATERNMRAFDEGFGACVQMVAAGADLEQLRAACGVVAMEWQDTEPHSAPVFDDDLPVR
jgi:hypothetical protein